MLTRFDQLKKQQTTAYCLENVKWVKTAKCRVVVKCSLNVNSCEYNTMKCRSVVVLTEVTYC